MCSADRTNNKSTVCVHSGVTHRLRVCRYRLFICIAGVTESQFHMFTAPLPVWTLDVTCSTIALMHPDW